MDIALDPITIAEGSLGVINILGRALGLSLVPVVVTILIAKTALSLALTILIALTALGVLWRMSTVGEDNDTFLEAVVQALVPDRS